MESTGRLREYAMECCPEHEDHDSTMMEIADEVEREVERDYMLLPRDANGVPICVGDEMKSMKTSTSGTVTSVAPQAFFLNHGTVGNNPRNFVHRHDDALEAMLRAFFHDALDADAFFTVKLDDVVDDYALRIREMMGGDAR